MVQICPCCGKKKERIIEKTNICSDCFKPNLNLPKIVDIRQCQKCRRIYISGKWKKPTTINILAFLRGIRELKNYEIISYDAETGTITLKVKIGNEIITYTDRTMLRIINLLCLDCARKNSGYFEAIIQLRGNNREKLNIIKEKICNHIKKRSFVSKVDNLKEGIDIYCGNKQTVFEVLHELKLKFNTTRKLHGKKDGRLIYRTTFLVKKIL